MPESPKTLDLENQFYPWLDVMFSEKAKELILARVKEGLPYDRLTEKLKHGLPSARKTPSPEQHPTFWRSEDEYGFTHEADDEGVGVSLDEEEFEYDDDGLG